VSSRGRLSEIGCRASSFCFQYFFNISVWSLITCLGFTQYFSFSCPLYLTFNKSVLEVRSYSRCVLSSESCFVFLCVRYSAPPWLYVALLHFSHDRSNWSSPSFSSTTFQNLQRNSGLLFEWGNFQHHKNCAPNAAFCSFILKFKSCLLNINEFPLLDLAFAVGILNLNPRIHSLLYICVNTVIYIYYCVFVPTHTHIYILKY